MKRKRGKEKESERTGGKRDEMVDDWLQMGRIINTVLAVLYYMQYTV